MIHSSRMIRAVIHGSGKVSACSVSAPTIQVLAKKLMMAGMNAGTPLSVIHHSREVFASTLNAAATAKSIRLPI